MTFRAHFLAGYNGQTRMVKIALFPTRVANHCTVFGSSYGVSHIIKQLFIRCGQRYPSFEQIELNILLFKSNVDESCLKIVKRTEYRLSSGTLLISNFFKSFKNPLSSLSSGDNRQQVSVITDTVLYFFSRKQQL